MAKKLGEMGNNLSEKQPYIKKAAKLKKHEKGVETISLERSLMAPRVLLKLPGKRWKRKTERMRRKRRGGGG